MAGRPPPVRDVTFAVEGLSEFLRALSKIDKDLQNNVRTASAEIADRLVSFAQARAETPLENLVARNLKARRDRVPVVAVGRQRVGSRGTPLNELFFGAEFGGDGRNTTRQFRPHKGRVGYFLYPALRDHSSQLYGMWVHAVDDAMSAWNNRVTGVL